MDTFEAITNLTKGNQTLHHNMNYVLNSTKFNYSNGSLEGINRKIQTLKRTYYGFANQKFIFLRINYIFS